MHSKAPFPARRFQGRVARLAGHVKQLLFSFVARIKRHAIRANQEALR